MKTKYKYIEFLKTVRGWSCRNWRDRLRLGDVRWHSRGKEWEFLPNNGLAFTIDCLRDIADFLDQLNKEGKP